ncbi:hypothetical protein [Actinotalea sp. K2]|uniref:hypothetical protein n=1 Tax=Actinotalea sp. K2 TaxID=2939438 RepID=UPI00201744F1|nr:hypothetical protein [Actinotalea sp. K2]MCL3862254.1 hypothetical protein [Actinotalea sp. K2]
MDTPSELLMIQVEQAGARSWWASLVATLTAVPGYRLHRLVAVVDGSPRYVSATFMAPVIGAVRWDEEAVPGLTRCLTDLCAEIETDGWVRTGRDAQLWEVRYARPGPGS